MKKRDRFPKSKLRDAIRSELRSAQNDSRTVYCVGLFGGCGLGVIKHFINHPADLHFVADVPAELDRIRPQLLQLPNVFVLPIGTSHTSGSLLGQIYDPNHEVFDNIGTSFGPNGMSSRSGLGEIAARMMTNGHSFSLAEERLREQILTTCDGAPDAIDWLAIASNGGGAGFPAMLECLDRFGKVFASMDIPANVRLLITDSIAYVGVPGAIHTNAARATMRVIDLVKSKQGRPTSKTSVNVRLLALPPLGRDQKTRSELGCLDVQAFASSQLQRQLQIEEPNLGLSHGLGNFSIVAMEAFNSIPAEAIAKIVATEYYATLEAALYAVGPRVETVERIDDGKVALPVSREPVAAIVESQVLDLDAKIQATIREAEIPSFNVTAFTVDGGEFRLDEMSDYFSQYPDAFETVYLNLTITATIVSTLQGELKFQSSKLARLRAEQSKQLAVTRKAYVKAQSNKPRAVNYAIDMGSKLRNISDQVNDTWAIESELGKLLKIAEQELASQKLRLEMLLIALDGHRNRGPASNAAPTFEFETFHEAFSRLANFVAASKQVQTDILAASVIKVTVNGLQEIAAADNNTIEALVDALLGPAVIRGSAVGGSPAATHRTIYVLPPVNGIVGNEIRTQIEARKSNCQVFVADSCRSGVNIVRYLINYPRSESEILRGYLPAELAKSREGSAQFLYYPDMKSIS